ncbi:SpoIIE family protein phosphatase [Streptomyces sp. cg28]|uniref:SpoIIE family protein phosphatase n=1 Tax=Streptomyces sp. cg28 TaxID=3403457 RepID=UPI003B20D356
MPPATTTCLRIDDGDPARPVAVPASDIFDSSPHGILIASTLEGGTTLYANGRIADLLAAEVPMQPGGLVETAHPLFDRNGEAMSFDESPLGIALRLRRPARAEVQYLVPGAEPLRLDITASPLECLHNGEGVAVAYLHDISPQHDAARALDEANHRLSEQLGDLTWVHRLTEKLTGHASVDDALDTVLAEGAQLLGADMGVARLYEHEQHGMRTKATYGVGTDTARQCDALLDTLREQDSLADMAARSGGWLIFEDVRTHPNATGTLRELGRLAGFRSVYVLALRNGAGRKLGVVAWAFREPGRPTARQRQLATTYCRFAGQVVENNRHYERERRIASTLQRTMLPSSLPEVPGISVTACTLPGAQGMQTGGDWYDVIALPGGKAGLALGDVMGKGLHAAAAMGQIRTALRSYALVTGEDPVAVLANLNHLTNDMGLTDLATAQYLTVDPAAHRAALASAGHCPPLLVDSEGARFIRSGEGVPLGVMDDWHAAEASIDLPEGALLILYTDGLVERRGEDLEAGLERLRQAALDAPDDLDQLCRHLVRSCLPNGSTADDVAILALRLKT